MKVELTKRTILNIGLFAFILLLALVKADWIFSFISRLFKLSAPLWLGLIIYYLLNRPYWAFRRLFSRIPVLQKGSRSSAPALILSYLLLLGTLAGFFFIIIPELVGNVYTLFSNYERYAESLHPVITKITNWYSEQNIDPALVANLKGRLTDLGKVVLSRGPVIIGSLLSNTASWLGNLLFALIISIYLIGGQDKNKEQFSRFLAALGGSKRDVILHIYKLADQTFYDYFYVQLTESMLLGLLCYIGMKIFQFPYALVISAIATVLAMIPVVGAFISTLIGAVIIVFVQAKSALPFVFFFIVLQQFEGNVIYPRRMDDRIGLPSIFVLLAVLLGGGIGGVTGAFIAVPVTTIVFRLCAEWVSSREKSAPTPKEPRPQTRK